MDIKKAVWKALEILFYTDDNQEVCPWCGKMIDKDKVIIPVGNHEVYLHRNCSEAYKKFKERNNV